MCENISLELNVQLVHVCINDAGVVNVLKTISMLLFPSAHYRVALHLSRAVDVSVCNAVTNKQISISVVICTKHEARQAKYWNNRHWLFWMFFDDFSVQNAHLDNSNESLLRASDADC